MHPPRAHFFFLLEWILRKFETVLARPSLLLLTPICFSSVNGVVLNGKMHFFSSSKYGMAGRATRPQRN